MPSLPSKLKIFLIPAENCWKIEIKAFPHCAISHQSRVCLLCSVHDCSRLAKSKWEIHGSSPPVATKPSKYICCIYIYLEKLFTNANFVEILSLSLSLAQVSNLILSENLVCTLVKVIKNTNYKNSLFSLKSNHKISNEKNRNEIQSCIPCTIPENHSGQLSPSSDSGLSMHLGCMGIFRDKQQPPKKQTS